MLCRRRRRRRKGRLLGSPRGRTVEKEWSTPGGGSRPVEWVHTGLSFDRIVDAVIVKPKGDPDEPFPRHSTNDPHPT
jgi:hypothetical protein